MKNRDRDIAELVEKFLDGRTTNAEERELYVWFRTHEVPEEWEPLRRMFAWYEAGMPDESVKAVADVRSARPQSRLMPLRRWLQIAGGCAAALVIILLLFRGDNDIDTLSRSTQVIDIVEVTPADDDLMYRADLIEQQAYELLAWADMNSL